MPLPLGALERTASCPDVMRAPCSGRMVTDAVERERDWRTWLVAALRDGPPADAGVAFDPGLLVAARREGVLALLEWRCRNSAGWGRLSEEWKRPLEESARAAAAQWLLRARELGKIAVILSQARIQALLLKGNALAFWLYPVPYLRDCGDIDLLFASREEAERAIAALEALGYRLVFEPGDTHFEMTCRQMVDGVCRSELDLHCRLLNSLAYADSFAFDELWDASSLIPGIDGHLRRLSASHAFAHACLNRALDLQNRIPDRLKLLWDVHLLVQSMDDAADWEHLVSTVQAKRLCGVCLCTLADAGAAFGSSVPATTLDALHRHADTEPVDYRRLGDWRYMQWQNLKALPGWAARGHWLWERLFPPRGQLEELHGSGSWPALMLRRMRSGLSRLG